MLKILKRKMNTTYTENGAATSRTSYSDCLDLFARAGAMRNAGDQEVIECFKRAYIENPDLAMKILFYIRDIRGGIGERRVFRTILSWLSDYRPDSIRRNISVIAEYGRFDDLLELLGTECQEDAVRTIARQLKSDMNALEKGDGVSLLAKWMPSVNASNAETIRKAKILCRELKMSEAIYRKTLSRLRVQIKIIENNLRERDYSFDYSKQPSKAMFKYRKAFIRNDMDRYREYLDNVECGKTKLNTGTLMPYDIVAPLLHWDYDTDCMCRKVTKEERRAMNASWNALEDYRSEENAIAVIDGSGSMYGPGTPMPASVALSLGIYFAEKNTGAFRNHFITFSENPQLVEIKGTDIVDKIIYCESFNEVANTNIQKTFELILNAALKNKVPQSEMPSTIYVISDMEFDCCSDGADKTNFGYVKELFEQNGYKLPKLVFWNVQSRSRNIPATMNDKGVVLVSGCTPRIFEMTLSGEYDPYEFMMKVICSGRYERIAA